jgi:hypothetical protein
MQDTVARIEALMRRQDSHENERGNVCHTAFLPDERYIVDFAPDLTSEGWLQFDTNQDAPYFGMWVNPSKFLTLTYAEGDWTLVVCPDKEHYNAEIQDAIEFYDEGYVAIAIGADGSSTKYVQDRSEFIIA